MFGAYLEKRELQNALGDDVFEQPGTDGELWLDYVADTGDGFDATFATACCIAGVPGLVVRDPAGGTPVAFPGPPPPES